MKKQIVVDIEVLDEEHCDRGCDQFISLYPYPTQCKITGKPLYTENGVMWFRTAECKKGELACSENKSIQQK